MIGNYLSLFFSYFFWSSVSSVYSWGYSSEGQTGHGSLFHIKSPQRLTFFDSLHIVRIACGSSWSTAVSQAGCLYGWGYNDGGWLGMSPPSRLPYLESDSSSGTAFSDFQQTRSFDSRHNVLTPQRVKSLAQFNVEQVRCGGGHTIIFANSRSSSTGLSRQDDDMLSADGKSPRLSNHDNSDGGLSGRVVITDSPGAGSKEIEVPLESKWSSGLRASSFGFTDSGGNVAMSASLASADSDELTAQLVSWSRHKKLAELEYALCRSGVDVNIRDSAGNTPLIVACQNGHTSVAKLLVTHHADINSQNQRGNTPLHYCYAYGFEELGDFLISIGADEFAVNGEGLTCYEGLTKSDLDKI